MKNLKKYLAILFVFFVCICSFGCSKINLNVVISSSGVITQKCEVDLSDLPSNYNNVTNIKTIMRELIQKYYQNQLTIAYEDKLVGLYNNVYTTDDYNYKYENGELKSKTNHEKFLYIINRNIHKYDYETTGVIEDNNRIYIELKFTNIYSYLLFFYPDLIVYDFDSDKITVDKTHHLLADVPLNGELEESGNAFVETYLQTCYPFYYNGSEPYLIYDCQIQNQDFYAGQTLRDVVFSLSGSTSEEVEYAFGFSTPYKRLHSNGEISLTSDGYTHSWKFESLDDSSILIYRKYAKPVFWYLTSFILGIAIVVVGFLIVGISRSVKKRKGMKYLNKIASLDRDKK